MSKSIGEMVGKRRDPRSVMGSNRLVSDTLIGLEIELEDIPRELWLNPFNYWEVKEEGSLRDRGCEFVFAQPLGGQDIISAIEELHTVFDTFRVSPLASERTSVHVHVDVRDMDEQQLFKFISLFLVFEKALYNYCGNGRDENIFCLPCFNAQGSLKGLKNLIKKEHGDRTIRKVSEESGRYSGINLNAIRRFGSLEFRLHSGTWDMDALLNWINILLSIRNAAIQKEEIDVKTIPNYISMRGSDAFIDEIFGDLSPLIKYHGVDKGIYDGVRLLQEVAILGDGISILDIQKELIGKPEDIENTGLYLYLKKKKKKAHKDLYGKNGIIPYLKDLGLLGGKKKQKIKFNIDELMGLGGDVEIPDEVLINIPEGEAVRMNRHVFKQWMNVRERVRVRFDIEVNEGEF